MTIAPPFASAGASRAVTFLTRGQLAAVAVLSLTANAAFSQNIAEIGRPDAYLGVTSVRMLPTDEPGAVAEVVIHNVLVNDERDNRPYPLAMGDVTASVTFRLNVSGGDDAFHIAVPAGFVAIPHTLVVMEGFSASALIFPLEWAPAS